MNYDIIVKIGNDKVYCICKFYFISIKFMIWKLVYMLSFREDIVNSLLFIFLSLEDLEYILLRICKRNLVNLLKLIVNLICIRKRM